MISHSSEINSSAKRARYEENNNAGCHRFKFKGVVPQQNGHWGAQIYANHQRIWLGTFKSERKAAMAYDSATIKLRSGGESHRNFPWNDETVQEPQFQSHYSAETVLTMIRNGTYPSKFATFLGTQSQSQGQGQGGVGINANKHVNVNVNVRVKGEEHFSCTQLFQKELTPSDVGKLNRIVIPKKHAVTYFPCICGSNNAETTNNETDGTCVDIEVVFYDRLMRLWKFRYCYWKSSQSYVFTRGWNRFVKDKKLKAKDIIAFYVCEPINCTKEGERQVFSLIDVIYNADERSHCFGGKKKKGDTEQILENKLICSEDEDEGQESRDGLDLNALDSAQNGQQGLRLFGVSIN